MGSLMAGQSVGLIHETKPVKDIVKGLVLEAEETFSSLGL
jgi:NAD(P)H-dependent flavin oxidoreductase YrpB (nitropropane dioxygenase family)